MPFCPAQYAKASYTVEAVVILPLFLFVSVVVLIFFQVQSKEWKTAVGLNEGARKLAVYGELLPQGTTVDVGVVQMDDKDITMKAVYVVPMPFDFFGLGGMAVTQQAKAHRWVGFDPSENEGRTDGIVYVTESGVAYHTTLDCTYLKPSIRTVAATEVRLERNASGHRYTACPLCGGGGSTVYITTYGESYHSSVTCSGLKRTIRSVTKETAEAEGYHACGKCAR